MVNAALVLHSRRNRMVPTRSSAAATRTLAAAFLTLALWCAPRAAPAGQVEDARAAREHTSRATAAYNLGHYDEASGEFEAAYRLIQDPALLFNVAQAHRLAGHDDKALTAYKAYLRTADPNAENRENALKWKQALESRPRDIVPIAQVPPPASQPSAAGEVPTGTLKAPQMTAPSPPEHVSSAVPNDDASEPRGAQLRITQGGSQEEKRPIYTRWWAWTILGVVGAGAAAVVLLNHNTQSPDCLGISPCGSVH